jgi:hypothetical protein
MINFSKTEFHSLLFSFLVIKGWLLHDLHIWLLHDLNIMLQLITFRVTDFFFSISSGGIMQNCIDTRAREL